MNNTIASRIVNRVNQIKALPICQLELRQPMLVDLLVMLVDYETDNGKRTHSHGGVQGQDYWRSLKEYAEGAGFKFLGAGHFSAAFKHEMLPGKVIKIGFKKEDSGAAYAAYCRANAGTVGLPVIHALARHASCYSVVLDELISLERRMPDSVQGDYNIVHEVISYKTGYNEVTQGVLTDYQHALAETARNIRSFFDGVASFDLHTGNVMMTNSGAIVITDPVSYSNDEALRDCDFDSIMDEIAALRLEEWARGRLAKWKKKHPTTEQRALRKARVKARRRMAKRKAKRLAGFAEAMLNDPLLDGPVFGPNGEKFERPARVKTKRGNWFSHNRIKRGRGMVEMFAADFGQLEVIAAAAAPRRRSNKMAVWAHHFGAGAHLMVHDELFMQAEPQMKQLKARNSPPEGIILQCDNWQAPKRNGFLKLNK